MKTKLVHIKYFKWTGDPVATNSEFTNEPNIDVNFRGNDLLLQDHKNANSYIRIKRGLYVVAILNPQSMGYDYFRMNDAQLNDYINTANQGSQLVLN